MKDLTRRGFVKFSSMVGAIVAGTAVGKLNAQATSFQVASETDGPGGPGDQHGPTRGGPGIQRVYALCEVTGGGQKVYGVAVQYDAEIDAASLSLDTFAVNVFAPVHGSMMTAPGVVGNNPNASSPRVVAAIYTNAKAGLLAEQKSVAGKYVIAEFAHDDDLSLPTRDSDKVSVMQRRDLRTAAGKVYPGSSSAHDNAGPRGNSVVIRGMDGWEQSHWWWDDEHATMLEYSIFLPKSFLKEGGEKKEYPLVVAITHSGTSYDGTCLETLTEQCIANIWGLPENQAEHECVVITPRYERTTLNDYWEHTHDVENTYRLVQSLLKNTWNFGNPNKADRADKVLKIDPRRVYCTGWSMGGMTSLWLMAKHPETFAAGLIIAAQQRPSDVATLAKQNLLIITGTEDGKATPWNEKCVPVWEQGGGKVTRPKEVLDPSLIFPVSDQKKLTAQVNGYLDKGGNITFLTFDKIDHMESCRKFFHIKAARNWLFAQTKA